MPMRFIQGEFLQDAEIFVQQRKIADIAQDGRSVAQGEGRRLREGVDVEVAVAGRVKITARNIGARRNTQHAFGRFPPFDSGMTPPPPTPIGVPET